GAPEPRAPTSPMASRVATAKQVCGVKQCALTGMRRSASPRGHDRPHHEPEPKKTEPCEPDLPLDEEREAEAADEPRPRHPARETPRLDRKSERGEVCEAVVDEHGE